jgi:hypothetical protein
MGAPAVPASNAGHQRLAPSDGGGFIGPALDLAALPSAEGVPFGQRQSRMPEDLALIETGIARHGAEIESAWWSEAAGVDLGWGEGRH